MKSEPEGKMKRFSLPELYRIILVIAIFVTLGFFVYLTGGTKMAYLQFMNIPIIISAFYWGIKGGIISAMIAGIIVGPFMPLDVSLGIMQTTDNWLIRMVIFILIGFLMGYFIKKTEELNREARMRTLTNPYTGINNVNKLYYDLENKIKSEENFTVTSIKLTNIIEIEKYVNHNYVKDIVAGLIKEIEHGYGRDGIYSSGLDEIILVTPPECSEHKNTIDCIVKKYYDPIPIDGYTFKLTLKLGVYKYTGGNETPIDIYNRARIAYEQGEEKESGIYYYDSKLERKRRQLYEITGSLLNSIKNDELYVVYQPKINIIDNSISGVEALIRWDRGENNPIGPAIFIRVAEEIGFVGEITKFVLNTVTNQMVEWQDKGIHIDYAINITPDELLDDSFILWGKNLIDKKGVDRKNIEIEITERVVSHDNVKLLQTLQVLREKNYKVSIDDFGTGYNSLMSIGEIPFDILKIDKYFIDRLHRLEIRELAASIIEFTHRVGKIVVAEGVETEEQLNILKEIKCDSAQGYYFSKPLLPHQFEKFHRDFDSTN